MNLHLLFLPRIEKNSTPLLNMQIFDKFRTTKSYQKWVVPFINPVIESDLKNITDLYNDNQIMQLFCCELNTRFELDCEYDNKLIHKLFPYY